MNMEHDIESSDSSSAAAQRLVARCNHRETLHATAGLRAIACCRIRARPEKLCAFTRSRGMDDGARGRC